MQEYFETIEREDGEFCVKTGLYFEDGCPVEFCPDITGCPFRPKEIELNPTE